MHGINLSFEHNTYKQNPIDRILSTSCGGIVGIHDFEYPYGQNQYFDIHAIFPDISRDTADESAYNFGPTDKCLGRIREYGHEIIFRLGESKDFYEFKPYLNPLRDADKFAEICLHIVMHYNAGFAGGYKWNIRNFEIWSGADTSNNFAGGVEDYISLYKKCALLIKQHFPKVRVGGYTSLGFSGMNRVTDNPELKNAGDFMERFLSAVADKNEEVPLDFLTWRCFANSAEELALHSKYARSMLRGHGIKAKSIVAEFDLTPKDRVPGAADYLAAMIVAEKSEIDALLYYNRGECEAKEIADLAYSELYKGAVAADISEDYKGEIYALAAHSEASAKALLATLNYNGAAEIFIRGGEYSCFNITEFTKKEDGSYSEAGIRNVAVKSGKVLFAVKPDAVYILEFLN